MNTSSTNPEAITALVDSLESHEGTLTERERRLCTTLLSGLAAAGRLSGVSLSGDLPDYDYEAATESERWAFDSGYERGWDARLDPPGMDLDDVLAEMRILVAVLGRLADEAEDARVAKLHTRGRIEFEDAVIELPDDDN